MPWKLSAQDLHQITVRAVCEDEHSSPCTFPACACGTRAEYEHLSNVVLRGLLPAITRQLFEVVAEAKPKPNEQA